MAHTHTVKKPFSAVEKNGEVVHPGEGFTPENATRQKALETRGLIEPGAPKAKPAPANKAQNGAPANKGAPVPPPPGK